MAEMLQNGVEKGALAMVYYFYTNKEAVGYDK